MPVSAQKLKALRVSKGLSQERFARAADVPYTTYIMWEQGKAQPNPDALRKLARYHGVTMESLFED
jgi:DNA-binding XRE family transcriptional regulator